MSKNDLKKMISLEINENEILFNGDKMAKDWMLEIIASKIYRTATVVKNARESDKGGIMATLNCAVSAGLIDAGQAFTIMSTKDKARVEELKKQLPKSEKDDEPSDEDIKLAISKVMAGAGQNDF